MRFQVPQFIEVEDKIFSQLTLKQFIYIAGGGGLCFIVYTTVPIYFIFRALLIIPIIIFSLSLAFYRVNNRPFINLVESAFNYYIKEKLYRWQKRDRKPEITNLSSVRENEMLPKVGNGRLNDLTWNLDINKK